MSQWLPIIVTLTGLVSTLLAMIVTVRNIKKTGPGEALKSWQQTVEDRLDNDHDRLKHTESAEVDRREFEQIMLHCMKGVLGHLAEGNHTGFMKELVNKIDTFLISK